MNQIKEREKKLHLLECEKEWHVDEISRIQMEIKQLTNDKAQDIE